MRSCPDRSHDPVTTLSGRSAVLQGFARLAEGALHIAAVLSLGMLAVACAVLGLIWFSMGLPNG